MLSIIIEMIASHNLDYRYGRTWMVVEATGADFGVVEGCIRRSLLRSRDGNRIRMDPSQVEPVESRNGRVLRHVGAGILAAMASRMAAINSCNPPGTPRFRHFIRVVGFPALRGWSCPRLDRSSLHRPQRPRKNPQR